MKKKPVKALRKDIFMKKDTVRERNTGKRVRAELINGAKEVLDNNLEKHIERFDF
jgi:hypothetical protein